MTKWKKLSHTIYQCKYHMFGIKELLSDETADKVWEVTNKHLKRKEMLPQSILKKTGAKIIFTTGDPADDLIYHKMANNIEGITFLPTFRPDAYCYRFKIPPAPAGGVSL